MDTVPSTSGHPGGISGAGSISPKPVANHAIEENGRTPEVSEPEDWGRICAGASSAALGSDGKVATGHADAGPIRPPPDGFRRQGPFLLDDFTQRNLELDFNATR